MTRDYVVFYLNGQRHEVRGEAVFKSVTDYFRYDLSLTGTKVVCAEGDCGACTLNLAQSQGDFRFRSVNSCILFVFQLDGCSVVTVEGLAQGDEPHPAQKSMVECFGSQCGFCTPGFIGSMAYLAEVAHEKKFKIEEKKARNFLTGNLCRCTGYEPILKACTEMQIDGWKSLQVRYGTTDIRTDLLNELAVPVQIKGKILELHLPVNSKAAAQLKNRNPELRIVAGATDLGVWVNKNKIQWQQVMSLQNCAELYETVDTEESIKIGARVSLEKVEKLTRKDFPRFSELLHVFASPQIKNGGTLVGNLVNASPIGDTLPFLVVSEALVNALSVRGPRQIPMSKFFTAYRETALAGDEIVTSIEIPKTTGEFYLYKICNRKDLDISVVTFALHCRREAGQLVDVRFALGGVGPTVKRFPEIEVLLEGQVLSAELCAQAAQKSLSLIKPLSDVRGSSEYRNALVKNFWNKLNRDFKGVINVNP